MKISFISIIMLLATMSLNAKETGCITGDCINGFGAIYYENGEKYIGEFVDGKKDGTGVFIYKNNEKFFGSWMRGLRNGIGKFYKNNQLQAIGIWENELLVKSKNYLNSCLSGDCEDGVGIFVLENGTKLTGKFTKGELNGKGIAYYLTGEKYIGEFKNNQRHGIGTIYSTLESINGMWTQDKLIGANKSFNSGCKSGNCINGKGVFVYNDNTVYEGEFLNGKPHGYGICQFADGDIYVGYWKNNFFEGKGTFYYSNGEIITGNWKESYLIPEKKAIVPTRSIKNNTESQGKVWAVIVGVAKYTTMKSLNYTDDDAYRLHSFLKSVEGGAIPDEQIKLLIDESAEKGSILRSLKEIAKKAGKNDSFIFYFSGHGLPGSFLPYDYDGYENELRYKEIMDVFKSSIAKSKIIIADACHSGGLIAHKGEGYQAAVKDYYDAIGSSKGGLVLMMSSKAEETSIENNGLRQGIFSHFLIRGLKGAANENGDGLIKFDELFNYIEYNVSFYTNYNQTPLIFGDNGIDLPIAIIRN